MKDMLIPKISAKDRIMIEKVLLGVLIGAGAGAMLGYFGKCSSGSCPLTANPYRGALYGAVLGAVFALGFSFEPKTQSGKSSQPQGGKAPEYLTRQAPLSRFNHGRGGAL